MNQEERFVSVVQKIEILEKERIFLRDSIVERMEQANQTVIDTPHGHLALSTWKKWIYPLAMENKYKRDKKEAQKRGTAIYTNGTSYLSYESNDQRELNKALKGI